MVPARRQHDRRPILLESLQHIIEDQVVPRLIPGDGRVGRCARRRVTSGYSPPKPSAASQTLLPLDRPRRLAGHVVAIDRSSTYIPDYDAVAHAGAKYTGQVRIDESLRYIRVQKQPVHIDDLGPVVSNYNRPVVIESEHAEFPFYFRGSACLLQLDAIPFVVTCFHGLKDITLLYDQIFLQTRLGGGDHFNIPLRRSFTPRQEFRNRYDCFDLVFFEAELSSLPEKTKLDFFDISKTRACYVPVSNKPILACGFPLSLGTADYDHQSISRPAVVVDGRFEKWSNEPHLFCCKALPNPDGCVSDGFSGCGAFGMIIDSIGLKLCFSGIVVRGGNSRFYAIDGHFVRRVLRNLIDNS